MALNLLKQDKATNSASSDAAVHPAVPDYIPRRNEADDWRYASEETLFGRLSPSEDALIDDIAALVGRAISLAPGAPVLAPYAIGGLSITSLPVAPLGAALGIALGAPTGHLLFWMSAGIAGWSAVLPLADTLGVIGIRSLVH